LPLAESPWWGVCGGGALVGWSRKEATIVDIGLSRRRNRGLTVTPERLTGVYKNMERGIVALVFRCSIADGTPTTTDEAAEIAWLTSDEITERMSEAYAIRMLDALASTAPAIRAHNGVSVYLASPLPYRTSD
jgi:hypothetical protein